MRPGWRRSVNDLDARLKKANDLFDREFPNVGQLSAEKEVESSVNMPSTTGARTENSYTENVIRDKNTIVQITVHTKPKDKENKVEAHFQEPTVRSKSRSLTTTEVRTARGQRSEAEVKSGRGERSEARPSTRDARSSAKQSRSRSRSNSQKVRKSSNKTKSSTKRQQSRKSSKHVQHDIQKDVYDISDKEKESKKDVSQVLKELKEIIQSSGVKDVYEFFQEMEDGCNRRKSAPEVMSGNKPVELGKIKPASKQPLKTIKPGNLEIRKDEDRENLELREKAKADQEKLIMEINKLKAETSRYKSEFDKSQVQLKIARESNQSFQAQIVEMKQLISKMTGNNKNLVQLVSDRSTQDEKMVELEKENKKLNYQLDTQNKLVQDLQNKVSVQEHEMIRLNSLRADINAQLLHGLEGLEIPRPASSLPNNLLNRTNDILGNTILKPDHRNARQRDHFGPNAASSTTSNKNRPDSSQSSDSAIDDPNSEKLATARPAVFHAPPPPRDAPPKSRNSLPLTNGSQAPAKDSQPSHSSRDAVNSPSRKAPPPPIRDNGASNRVAPAAGSQDNPGNPVRSGSGNPGGSGPGTPSTQPYPSTQSSASKPGGYIRQPNFRLPQSSMYSNSPPTRQVSSRLRQQENEDHEDEFNVLAGAVSSTMVSRRTSRNLFTTNMSRAASSTLMNSILTEDHLVSKDNTIQATEQRVADEEGATPDNRFAPVQLDMEETADPDDPEEHDDLDGISGQTKSTPATIIHQNQGKKCGSASTTSDTPNSSTSSDITALKNMKPNLESKVEDFLARLRQDSLNYSMPQAKSFQGASFHLSLSGDDLLQDLSRDTTLTEGKFRRGLDSSIDVLSQD